jgi:hypothetical protein
MKHQAEQARQAGKQQAKSLPHNIIMLLKTSIVDFRQCYVIVGPAFRQAASTEHIHF